jgi:hypothetical protein
MILAAVTNLGWLTADDHGELSVTQSAVHNPTEEVSAALCSPIQAAKASAVESVLHLAIHLLDSLPKLVRYDSEIGNLYLYPFRLLLHTLVLFTVRRVDHFLRPVPMADTTVQLVVGNLLNG